MTIAANSADVRKKSIEQAVARELARRRLLSWIYLGILVIPIAIIVYISRQGLSMKETIKTVAVQAADRTTEEAKKKADQALATAEKVSDRQDRLEDGLKNISNNVTELHRVQSIGAPERDPAFERQMRARIAGLEERMGQITPFVQEVETNRPILANLQRELTERGRQLDELESHQEKLLQAITKAQEDITVNRDALGELAKRVQTLEKDVQTMKEDIKHLRRTKVDWEGN